MNDKEPAILDSSATTSRGKPLTPGFSDDPKLKIFWEEFKEKYLQSSYFVELSYYADVEESPALKKIPKEKSAAEMKIDADARARDIQLLEEILFEPGGMEEALSRRHLLKPSSQPVTIHGQLIEKHREKNFKELKIRFDHLFSAFTHFAYPHDEPHNPRRNLGKAVVNEFGRQWAKCRGQPCAPDYVRDTLLFHNTTAESLATGLELMTERVYRKFTVTAENAVIKKFPARAEEIHLWLKKKERSNFVGSLAKYVPEEGSFITFAMTFHTDTKLIHSLVRHLGSEHQQDDYAHNLGDMDRSMPSSKNSMAAVDAADELEWVKGLIEKMCKDKKRTISEMGKVLRLKFLEGEYTNKQIADSLGLSESLVMSHIKRGREHLLKMMEPEPDPDKSTKARH